MTRTIPTDSHMMDPSEFDRTLERPIHVAYDDIEREIRNLQELNRVYVLPDSDRVHNARVLRNPETGVIVRHVEVADPYLAKLKEEGDAEAYAYALERRRLVLDFLGEEEARLRSDPRPEAGAESRARIFGDSEALVSWREKLIPTAMALYPLQVPDLDVLPKTGVPVDERARAMLTDSVDAIGMRSRAVVMTELLLDHARRLGMRGKHNLEWLSIACGAAKPLLDGLAELRKAAPNMHVTPTMMDKSRTALAFADQLAQSPEYGLKPDDYTLERGDVIKGLIQSDEYVRHYGEGRADMVDLLGIFEYFPKEMGAELLRNSYRMVAEGGMLVFGNMLITHPQLEVNQRAVEWPFIQPRSIDEIMEIVDNAGIPREYVSIFAPTDGVYAVVRIGKPAGEQPVSVQPEVSTFAEQNGHANGGKHKRFGLFALKQLLRRGRGQGSSPLLPAYEPEAPDRAA